MRQEIERLTARVVQLEQEKKDLESFVAVAAHEMVEPLIISEAYAAMIRDRLDPEDVESRTAVDVMSRNAARTRLLLESLLQEARAADRVPSFEGFELDETAAECVVALGTEIEARGARVTLGALPRVRGDSILVGCVISNLLMNALKYSPRQDPEIRVSADRDGAWWSISVTSGGPTILPQDRERIFAQFERAKDERRARGTGLGLAICRRIVERHGGTIGVTAAHGSGTGNRFYFTLPAG